MKKIILFVVFALAFAYGFECFAQTGPIQPYKENDYTPEEVKSFIAKGSLLSFNWRMELANIINKGLADAGETIVLKETREATNIDWIMSHVVYERRLLVSFENSKRVGSEVVFFLDSNFDGMVAVFRYGKCELVIYKTRCINLTKVPVIKVPVQTNPVFVQPIVIYDTTYKTVVIEQPVSNNPNERIVTAGRTVTVGSGATYHPQNQYYGGGCYGCPPPQRQRYVNNHVYVDHGTRTYQTPNYNQPVHTGNRPGTVNVPYGNGGNNGGGGGSMPNGQGSGSGGRP